MNRQLVICDTNVLSRYILQTPAFEDVIERRIGVQQVCITPVVHIEFLNWVSGFRQLDKRQRAVALRFIKRQRVLHITESISELAVALSNGNINSKPNDTLIAATALYHDLPVYTLNRKDFAPLGVMLFE